MMGSQQNLALLKKQRYLQQQGEICPCCLRENIESDEIEPFGEGELQHKQCMGCDAEWVDIRKNNALVGYKVIA